MRDSPRERGAIWRIAVRWLADIGAHGVTRPATMEFGQKSLAHRYRRMGSGESLHFSLFFCGSNPASNKYRLW